MPKGYKQVPDWFSTENAGGGVAIVDLDGNGKEDIAIICCKNNKEMRYSS